MKAQTKNRTLLILVVLAINFISWSFLKPGQKGEKHNHAYHAYAAIVDTEDNSLSKIPVTDNYPPAKNVFVQKIKGDDAHILIIAQYSKTDVHERYLAINNNETKLVFRDDGKGADKIADDGLYTSIIKTDVSEFRKNAVAKNNQLLLSKQRPLKFVGREIISPLINAPVNKFDLQKFDDNEAVPVSDVDALTVDHATLKDHSLMITDVSVVEDLTRTWNSCDQTGNVDGPWTFKTLMKNLASTNPSNPATDAQVSNFVLNWLNNWKAAKTINGEKVPARTNVTPKIIQPWLDRSFEAGAPNGQLDMSFAPFKLLAIVNRVDLRAGGNANAGEGRFVFGLINSSCNDKEEFTVIFEYDIPKSGCSNVQGYAQQWFDLSNLTLGSAEYNLALQNITDQFTLCGTSPSKPNQSSLDRLRTNEVAIAPPSQIWELREFLISGTTHLLQETTVDKEPAVRYNAKIDNANVRRLKQFTSKNQTLIKNNTYTVPKKFQRNAFQGAHALTKAPPAGNSIPQVHHWDGTTSATPLSFITDDTVRHLFSLNTCSGCHGGETQTGFTQVDPVFFKFTATLSGFLTGKAENGSFDFDNDNTNNILTVEDAAGRPTSAPAFRGFNDLERRAIDLENLTSSTCGSVSQIKNLLLFKPLNMTH